MTGKPSNAREALLAELLGDVQHKQQKPSQAIKTTQPGDHGIRLIQRFDSKANLPELLKQISEQCAYAAERNWTRDCRSRPIPATCPSRSSNPARRAANS